MAPLLQFHKKLQGKHTFLKEKKYFVLGELCLVLRGCGVAKWLADLPSAREFVCSLLGLSPKHLAPGTMAPGTMAPGTMAPGTMAPGTMAPGTMHLTSCY